MRMVEEPSAAYDEVADAYSRTFDPDGLELRDPTFEHLLGDVSGQEVLSLACGQGRDARLLAALGATVTGLDVSSQMLAQARRRESDLPLGITYVQGNAQELGPFDAGSFDGVACHMALMDIPSLRPTITSVARVLRPRGWFVFSIVHPCFHGHVQVVSDYLLDERYAKRVPIDALPVHAYHRPLSDYVNELDAAELQLRRMVEIRHATDPGDGGVPGLLYARAVKR